MNIKVLDSLAKNDLFKSSPSSAGGVAKEGLLLGVDGLPDRDWVALGALALGAGSRNRTWLMGMLNKIQALTGVGQPYSLEGLKSLISQWFERGWVREDERNKGAWYVVPEIYFEVYLKLVDARDGGALRAALAEMLNYTLGAKFASVAQAAAMVRLALFTRVPFSDIEQFRGQTGWNVPWAEVLEKAAFELISEASFKRLPQNLRYHFLLRELMQLTTRWRVSKWPLRLLVPEYLAAHAQAVQLRFMFAEYLLMADGLEEVRDVLKPLLEPGTEAAVLATARAFDAAVMARQGRWAEAEDAFELVLKELRTKTGSRKNLLPEAVAVLYVQALLAQQTAVHNVKALKFCLAEGGRRTAALNEWSGIVAFALQVRLGHQAHDPGVFESRDAGIYSHKEDFWRWLMLAWLKADSSPRALTADQLRSIEGLRQALVDAGLLGLVGQLEAAVKVLQGKSPGTVFFVPPPQEPWRVALAALEAVAAPPPSQGPENSAETRMFWVLSTQPNGALLDIKPYEQQRGARGWSKAKAVSLLKLSKATHLLPADAAVARAIRPPVLNRAMRLDLAAAAVALVGHPHLEFEDAPGVSVNLVEASPEIDVVQVGDQRRVRMLPGLQQRRTPSMYPLSAAEEKELEALALISMVRESKQRARLIQLSSAQRRVAQLLGEGLLVPVDGLPQLEQVLRGLGAHFQVHADEVHADREVASEARLRAELALSGEGVTLRLVVAPLGPEGPRLSPGQGRQRLVGAVQGETLGVQRDLAQERTHLATVMDACPMLDPVLPGQASFEWLLEGADDALSLLEQLYALQATGSALLALDWPAGKAIRVDTAALSQLQLQVRSANDWLALQGGVTVDEGLVLSLSQMLDWARNGKSRFVALGEGRYLALTQELRSRLDELGSVADVQRDEARVPTVASAWLESVVSGAEVKADKAFAQRIKHLVSAQEACIELPSGLQAQLRPYQEEGYQWAMRLAQAGLGACLADDMGLGKTLQALAVLLARAQGGPALLVAPSSLMGNWQAEARRFAPSLQFHVYGETERVGLIERLGPHDVLLVSYQLHQQNVEAFGEREWHTLVLDEAQAIKNAAAKRALAVYNMRSAFRLALSGTPIENRLSELWSVMRVCNPGLLGTLARFNERFAGPIERDRNRPAQRTLRRLIAPFVLRRTKAQVLDDLPPRTELTLMVEPDAAEKAHYEALRRQALEAAQQSLSGGTGGQAQINILAELTRLRRAACDPRLVTPGLGFVGAKVQAFGDLAVELSANGHKALVFSQFVDFLTLLREPLDKAGLKYQYLDGSTPSAERTRRVAAFQAGEGDLFLISLKAGGFGLNLTMADYVVIADPWWNPAAEDQASGRAHRIGQQRPVTVYRLVNRGTLEERIVALHQSKRDLADSVLEGGEVGGVLKADELVALMQGD